MAVTTVVQVEGLQQVLRRMDGLRGRELEKRIAGVITSSLRKDVVPAMRAAAPVSSRGMGGRNPHAPGTLKRAIDVRVARKRTGEMVALRAGPSGRRGPASTRAWYAHFPVRGTKPHLISAPGLSSSAVRRINRSGARALAFNGIIRGAVMHPGARANPAYVEAGKARMATLNRHIAAELLRLPTGRT
jgi:hypothetical protein